MEVLNLPTLRGIEDDNLRRLLNNLILELYKYQAQAERERIKERQAQGIAIAKTQGKYQGRKALFSEDDSTPLFNVCFNNDKNIYKNHDLNIDFYHDIYYNSSIKRRK